MRIIIQKYSGAGSEAAYTGKAQKAANMERLQFEGDAVC